MPTNPSPIPALAAGLTVLVLAAMVPAPVNPDLRVTNLVPRFLAFHEQAEGLELSMRQSAEAEGESFRWSRFEEARNELWNEHLGELGDLVSRKGNRPWEPEGLDEAWDRYRQSLDRIRRAADGISPDPQAVLRQVAELLRLDQQFQLDLIVYVGTFQDEPAFRRRGGEYSILLPAERLPANMRPILVDLYTRAIHARLSGRPADDELSLAQHLFLRGLALRVHEEAEPGRWSHEYLLRSQDWLLAAEGRDAAILEGVRASLDERDPSRLIRFLEGGGATGLDGEFDYAAWRISGMLLMEGWTLDRLARVPEGEVAALVAEAIRER